MTSAVSSTQKTTTLPNVGNATLTSSRGASAAPSSSNNEAERVSKAREPLYAFVADNADQKAIAKLDELSKDEKGKVDLKKELTMLAKTDQGKEAVNKLASAGNSVAQDVLSAIGSAGSSDRAKVSGRGNEASQPGLRPSTIAVA